MTEGDRSTFENGSEIAIVGMALRFPGAASIDEYWRALHAGRDCLTTLTQDELDVAGLPQRLRESPDYVPVAGILDDVELFDAAFFGMSSRELGFRSFEGVSGGLVGRASVTGLGG